MRILERATKARKCRGNSALLTDNRVACHAGPFDHPSLALPMGGTATPTGVLGNDTIKKLPAVGVGGLTATGKPCFPNTGDLFGTLDPTNPLGLQDAIARILQSAFP